MDKVIVEFRTDDTSKRTLKLDGSFYVAITRVQNGNSLILRDFQTEYVHVSSHVQVELSRMIDHNKYLMYKTFLYDKVFTTNNELKIGYLNINRLLQANHIRDFDEDKNLHNLDFIILSETWLTNAEKSIDINNILKTGY